MYLCSEALYYQVYGLTLRTNQPLPILIPALTTSTVNVEVNLVEGDLSLLLHQDKAEDKQYRSGWYTQQKVDGIYHCLSLGGSSEVLDIEIAPTGASISITWANVPLEEVTAILRALRVRNCLTVTRKNLPSQQCYSGR